jgi:Tol biopolymer transport system component
MTARWRRSVAAFLVVAVFLLVPVTSQATLAFTRNPLDPVVFAANDDGSGAHRLGAGSSPRVSPNGQIVALFHQGRGRAAQPELILAPADGGAPLSSLATGWRESFTFAWSPDSASVAAVLGPELGAKRLVLIDVVTGAQRTIARGFFSGVSFAPEGGQLVYGRAPSEGFPPRPDVYRFDILPPGATSVAAEEPHRITNDHRSSSPLWGSKGIVFVKQLGGKRRKYGPKNDLFLMAPDGGKVRRLTHTVVGPLLFGLSPTEWSADGTRLLAEFGGQDTSYAVTVNPRTGAERTLTREREVGFVGTALSKDGTTVLGSIGGFEPGPGHKVVSIPYIGGKPKVLANNASEPDWSR